MIALRRGEPHAPPEEEPSERNAGHHTDFDTFYAASFQRLTLQLLAYLGDVNDAQDVVQEAFCRALAQWDKIAHYADPASWVRRVAWNLATSGFRRRQVARNFLRRQREQHVEGPGPDRIALTRALALLPAQHRRVVVLRYIGQLTVAEIAEQEGVAEGTVKSWLHRGRAQLAAHLADGTDNIQIISGGKEAGRA